MTLQKVLRCKDEATQCFWNKIKVINNVVNNNECSLLVKTTVPIVAGKTKFSITLPFEADAIKTQVFGYKYEYEIVKKQTYLTVKLDKYFVKYTKKEIYLTIELLENCDLKGKYRTKLNMGVLILR